MGAHAPFAKREYREALKGVSIKYYSLRKAPVLGGMATRRCVAMSLMAREVPWPRRIAWPCYPATDHSRPDKAVVSPGETFSVLYLYLAGKVRLSPGCAALLRPVPWWHVRRRRTVKRNAFCGASFFLAAAILSIDSGLNPSFVAAFGWRDFHGICALFDFGRNMDYTCAV